MNLPISIRVTLLTLVAAAIGWSVTSFLENLKEARSSVPDYGQLASEIERIDLAESFSIDLGDTNLTRMEERIGEYHARIQRIRTSQPTNSAFLTGLIHLAQENRIKSAADSGVALEASANQPEFIVTILSKQAKYLQKESEAWGDLELFWVKSKSDGVASLSADTEVPTTKLLEYLESLRSQKMSRALSKAQLSELMKGLKKREADLGRSFKNRKTNAGIYGACFGGLTCIFFILLRPYHRAGSKKSNAS